MNNTTQNIWGTKTEQNLTETVALYVAFTAEVNAGTEDSDTTSDLFAGFESGPSMDDSEWASF